MVCAALLLVGCSTEPSPRPAPPEDPPSVLTPSASAGPSPQTVDKPKVVWAYEPPDELDGSSQLLRSGAISVLVNDGHLYGIDARGRGIWERAFPDDMLEASFSDGVLVATYSNDGGAAAAALDPHTGKTLWSRKNRSRSSASRDTVYAARCSDQTGTIGDCQLTAYEPRTGQARWTQPTEWNPHPVSASFGEDDDPTPAGGPHVLLETAPTGAGDVTVTVRDSRTGQPRDVRFRDDAVGKLGLAGDTLVMPTREDEHPRRDRCTSDLRAVDVRSGNVRWKRTIGTAISEHAGSSGDSCSGFQPALGNGKQAMVYTGDGKPRMLDLTTGKFGWTASKAATVVAAGDRVAVLSGRDGPGLSAHEIATGKELWREEVELSDAYGSRLVGNRLIAAPTGMSCGGSAGSDACEAVVYDARKGTPLAGLPDAPTAVGDGWAATEDTSDDGITLYSTR